MIEKLRKQLLRHEGLRLRLYNDSSGIPTIGVGRNARDVGITTEEAMYLLDNDIRSFINQAESVFEWFPSLDEPRQMVVVNMIFNLGIIGFTGFRKMITAIEDGDYLEAAEEMIDSLWAKQVGARAIELAGLMRGRPEL